jgi:excinuclease UvrABC nuclease subunit
MLGHTGLVLYVGQSARLRTRLLSYFRAKGRRNKAARILRHAFRIEWEYTPTPFGALLRELRLIKQHRPTFNAMMVADDWPRAYVALTGGPVPGLRVVARSDDPAADALFGPFRRASRLRDAVHALAEAMRLRDCTVDDPRTGIAPRRLWFDAGQPARAATATASRRTPACLRHDVGTCPGPCIGAGDADAYRDAVADARAFLEGRSDAPVRALREAMDAAAAMLHFERAAVLRDRLALVEWLHQRVRRFRADMDRLTFRYHARTADGGEHVYLVRRGTVRAECPSPRTVDEHAALEALTRRVFLGPDPTGADIPTHDLDEFYLVASWFRRHPAEREATRAAP